MTLHYIDNEPAWTGAANPTPEWTALTEAGGSTIDRSADAAFPERGSYGLRAVTAAGAAYLRRTVAVELAAAGSIFVGAWLNLRALHAASFALWLSLKVGGAYVLRGYLTTAGQLTAFLAHAGGNQYLSSSGYLTIDRWHYVVVEMLRSSADLVADGGVRMYFDGALVLNGIGYDNFDEADDIDQLNLGPQTGTAGFECDFDEIKLDEAHPEPYVPTPADEYPSAERTVVLWRRDSSDARDFADYCVSTLGVPRANLISVDVGAAEDTNVAGYSGNVRDEITAYFALNPTVAANCTCFLLGYGTAGIIAAGGNNYSMATCLMRWPETPSFPTANPLYAPATVERLTLTALRAAGLYLACRIDADTLDHAKAIVARGVAVAALAGLEDDDTLFSDEAAYLASVGCQRLRIVTAALGSYSHDAFIWGDTGAPFFISPAGSSVAFADTSADSADTLRATTSACGEALHTAGYAAALGNSDAADAFDAASFFEMLRIGGTLAEAFAVAIANLDYTAVPVGSPLMAVPFQLAGYNAYVGAGGADSIDYDAIVGAVRAGVDTIDLDATAPGLNLADDTDYWFGLRAVSSAGVEEDGAACVVRVRISAGALVGQPPNKPVWASAAPAADGAVTITAYYSAAASGGEASGLQVAPIVAATGLPDWANLLTTISVAGSGLYAETPAGTYADGETVRFAVRAVTAGGVTGPAVRTNPMAADTSAPAAVSRLEGAQYA